MPTSLRGDSAMGQGNSKQAFVRSQELLQERGAGFKKQMLEKFLAQVHLCCTWFPKVEKKEGEKENRFQKSSCPLSRTHQQKNGHKLFQSSPRELEIGRCPASSLAPTGDILSFSSRSLRQDILGPFGTSSSLPSVFIVCPCLSIYVCFCFFV